MTVLTINKSINHSEQISYPEVSLSSSAIKIKAFNGETGEFLEEIIPIAAEKPNEYFLGRHPSCDLILDSTLVSRIHGRFWCQDGECFFTDLGSTNGSQIDEQEVVINQAYPLKQNNLLRVGEYVLKIEHVSWNQKEFQRKQSTLQAAFDSSQPRYWSSGELTVRCIQVLAETHDVKTFRFVAEPGVLFSYKPGQFVTLELEIEGKRIMRSYSISSTPSRPHILEITVKRVPAPTDTEDIPPGLVSNWLHDNLTVDSQVKIKGPTGKFTCVDNQAKKILFISAGSGITPMMSMSRWLIDTGADVDIVFIHSARSSRDFIFRQELESMAARYSNFKLAVTTTRSEPGQAWHGYSGRLNELMVQAIAPDFQERVVYVCGPNPFMEGVKTVLETLGLPRENYHQESFGIPKRKLTVKKRRVDQQITEEKAKISQKESNSKSSPYQKFLSETVSEKAENVIPLKSNHKRSPVIFFSKSDKEISGDTEETILDLAEQEGIDLPAGCRMGVCGACKLPLIEGEVNYDEDPECEPGHLLCCVAKPMGKVIIEA